MKPAAVPSLLFVVLTSLCAVGLTVSAEEEKDFEIEPSHVGALKVRSLGPALMSGRVGDFAVNPDKPSEYFVAFCSGGVWRTTNGGVTYDPVFDSYGSYSIGCITMDPNNPSVLWVGTGENNSQRSVSFGDGVYKSTNSGNSWEKVGLGESEHIGMIAVDPRDSDVVYVAAQGPLWRSGGDRGLYKTSDGGKTWERVLHISDDTGINEVHLDPRDPDTIYASAYQRRRHVWTLINGGPESGIYKSTDGGGSWREITSGIPSVDKGRIGIDVSPANPDVVYAIVEAADGEGGVFRSTDRGETWSKRSGYMTTSPQYYNEIYCDPHDVDRLYFADTFLRVSEDGGKTIERVPIRNKHVDDHAMWIDPSNTDHLLVGCDGGVYETFDRGEHWHFKPNLPCTQFYRVAVDNSKPFYYIYGGTQDNNTQGGPHRTTDAIGIANEHWFVVVGGDGFEPAIDPTDPNIVYGQWQYGGLVRHDRRSGEIVDIKPREKPGEDPNKWNWDSPLLISPHNHERLFYASQFLHQSDDRGNSWRRISPDLTRQIDRNQLEVMGRIQPPDAVAKDMSTSMYGSIVALSESPLVEGLIYVGTDDGLVQISEDGGANWRREEAFPSVPEMSFVEWLRASQHNPDRVYAAFDNKKKGDFTPYVYRSDDRGHTWKSIRGDMPDREIVHSVAEDHENPDLLFAGTEFGAYFTIDGGEHWVKIPGLPTIAVEDLEIQKDENDLVMATFGRGFYVLDNYAPLRELSRDSLDADAHLFAVKDALLYIESNRLGDRNGKGSQGASYYAAPNPPYGAVFTYHLKDKLTTPKEDRKEREKGDDWTYPSLEELRAEDRARDPRIVLTVKDDNGQVVRRIDGPRSDGMHRVAWDLRYPPVSPIDLNPSGPDNPWSWVPRGQLALPGTYTVTLSKEVEGEMTDLAGPVSFSVEPLGNATFAATDRREMFEFQRKVGRLHRAVQGALRVANDAQERIDHCRKAVNETPDADPVLLTRVESINDTLDEIKVALRGDPSVSGRMHPQSPSISSRASSIVADQWDVTSPPTGTQREQYEYASTEFTGVLDALRTLVQQTIPSVENELEAAGAPYTPGRFPDWRPE